MFRPIILLAALGLTACEQGVTPGTAGAPSTNPAQTRAIVQDQVTPGIQVCLAYARGGELDTALLSRAGFSGPRQSLGGSTYDAANLFLVINENRNRCRITWNQAPGGSDAVPTLRAVLANAGFVQSGRDGNLILYTDGTRTIAVQSRFLRSSTLSALEMIFERR